MAPQRIATNVHVISGGGTVSVITADRKQFTAVSAQIDEPHDLAVLECPSAASAAILKLGDPARVAVGETVVAAGSPLGLQGTISTGIVSSKREINGVAVLQTTAPVSPGSSGGPLIDKYGLVVGVTSFIAATGQNLNFAQLSSHLATLLRSGGKLVDFHRGETILAKPDKADPNQGTLLALLAQPAFSGPEFKERLIGVAQLELLDVGRQRVYFSLSRAEANDESDRPRVDAIAKKFIAEPGRIVLAGTEGLQARFPDYTFQRSGQKWVFFATDVANLRLGTGGPLTFKYNYAEYVVSTGELKSFLEKASVRGGAAVVDVSAYASQIGARALTNWGALVARPDEPSLSRFVKSLTTGLAGPEAKIQRLTDLVAGEIETDHLPSATIGKNAADVLLTRRGSTMQKAVLLASLLEQLPADYALVYSGHETWVAVVQGLFKNDNRLAFPFNGKQWTLIDLRGPSFTIGVATAPTQPNLEDLRFVQLPQQDQSLYSRADGKPIGNP